MNKEYIPHAFSSDQSEQSLVLSHTLELLIHRPLAQVKLSLEHFTVVLTEKETENYYGMLKSEKKHNKHE